MTKKKLNEHLAAMSTAWIEPDGVWIRGFGPVLHSGDRGTEKEDPSERTMAQRARSAAEHLIDFANACDKRADIEEI